MENTTTQRIDKSTILPFFTNEADCEKEIDVTYLDMLKCAAPLLSPQNYEICKFFKLKKNDQSKNLKK